MEIKSAMIMVLIVAFVIVCLAATITNFATSYELSVPAGMTELSNTMNNMTTRMGVVTEDMRNKTGSNIWGDFYLLTSGIAQLVLLGLFTLPTMVMQTLTALIAATSEMPIGLSNGLLNTILSILNVIILINFIFAVVYIIAKVKA